MHVLYTIIIVKKKAEEGSTLRAESYNVFEDFTRVLTCNKFYHNNCLHSRE